MSKKASLPILRNVGTIVLVLASLVAGSALAQSQSVLTGVVRDTSTKQPVADVVVTATSPSLQGEQVVVSDNTGTYRIPQLPPGVYTLRFEKESFRPLSRSQMMLRAGITARADVELLPETATVTEEVVVVGRPPTIDVGSSSTGVTIGSDFVKNIAVARPTGRGGAARSFESLAAIAPQAQGDAFGVSINGATSPENSYQIDGVAVNNPGFGINGTPLTLEFVDEVNVITGGYLPEYGRTTGGTIAAITKSGGNEFRGDVWANLSPGSLNGTPHAVTTKGSVFSTTQNPYWIGDVGADLGGYILKDRLWFYAGIAPNFQRYSWTRDLNQLDADGNIAQALPGTHSARFADQKQLQYIGKLTYLITSDHRLSLTVTGTPSVSGSAHTWGFDPKTGGINAVANSTFAAANNITTASTTDVSLKESDSFLDKRFLLDTTLGWHHQSEVNAAVDGTTVGGTTGLAGIPGVVYRRNKPRRHNITDFETLPADAAALCAATAENPNPCPVTTYSAGGPGFLDSTVLDAYQGKITGTYLLNALGHHVFKAGFDLNVGSFNHDKGYSGGTLYRENTTGTAYTDYRQYGYLKGPDDFVIQTHQLAQSISSVIGGFVQDSWSILDVVTLNVGVRYDTQNIYGADGKNGLSLPNQWSPRVGLVYDFTQQGKSKLYANFSRYYENVPLDISDRSFPGERQIQSSHYAKAGTGHTGCDPLHDPASCSLQSSRRPIFGLAGNPDNYWAVTGGDQVPVDPNIQPQSSDEVVAGGEYEILANSRLGAQYTHRYLGHVIEDMSKDEATTYFIGNPGYGIASDFPKAQRLYDAATVYFTKSFADLWLAQVSYTYSRLTGNYAGLFRAETGQLDPNINSTFDLKSLLPNQTGPLPGDVTHAIKIYAAKEFILSGPVSLTIGLSYNGESGNPLNYLGSHPLYGPGEAYILPRGSAGRLPWVNDIDGHVAVNFRLSKDSVLALNADIFNIANFQTETSVDENYTNSDVRPILGNASKAGLLATPSTLVNSDGSPYDHTTEDNPNFLHARQYQSTRAFRFGAKISF